MSTLTLDHDPTAHPPLVAPRWHTALLVGMFVAMAIAGAALQHGVTAATGQPQTGSVAPLYLSLTAMEWGLVLYVGRAGLRRRGVSLRTLVGGRWRRPRDVAIDVLMGISVWGVWTALGRLLDRWLGADAAAQVGAMLPHGRIEVVLWIGLSLSAGFAEELVFRGYLQAQLHALTHRRTIALVLQATLFGISHGYQGARACLRIAIYGLLMGVLALARGNLRAGMVAHAWTDIAAGILRI